MQSYKKNQFETFHDYLIECLKVGKYSKKCVDDDQPGFCHGYVMTVIMKGLTSEFDNCRELISVLTKERKHNPEIILQQLKKIKQNKCSDDINSKLPHSELTYNDLDQFLNKIASLQMISLLYHQAISSQHIDEILFNDTITHERNHAKDHHINKAMHYVGIYSKSELVTFMSYLNGIAEKNQTNFALELNMGIHAIGLLYRYPKAWYLIDANHDLIKINQNKQCADLIVKKMYDCFFEDNLNNHLGFVTKIYGIKNSAIQDVMRQLKQSEIYQKLHENIEKRLNTKTGNGITLSYLAAQFDLSDVLKNISHTHANMNLADDNKNTPFYMAVQNNHIHCMKLLYDHSKSKKIVTLRNQWDMTPLYIAAEQDNSEAMTWLFAHGAKEGVNQESTDGATPLYIAAQEGNTACISLLLNNGADIDFVSKKLDGNTSLIVACLSLHPSTLYQELLKRNPDLTIKNKFSKTALDIAIEKNNQVALIEVLHYIDKQCDQPLNQFLSSRNLNKLFRMAQTNNVLENVLTLYKEKESVDTKVKRTLRNKFKLHQPQCHSPETNNDSYKRRKVSPN